MTEAEDLLRGEPEGWQHSELLGRRSLLGAMALITAAALFFFLPPFIDGKTEFAIAGPDGRYAIDDFASIEIADGWGIESQSELITVIVNGGASAVLTPTVETDTSAPQYAQQLADGLNDSGTWIVESIVEFTTDAGVPGSSYLAHGTDQVSASWVVVDDGRLWIFSAVASEASFKTGFDDLEQMAKSVVFGSGAGAGE